MNSCNVLTKKLLQSFYWVPLLLFLAVYLYKSYAFPPHDFSNSYFPAFFLIHGNLGNWIFDPYSFNKNIFDWGFKGIYASFNPNPPFTAVFYLPFALLPLKISKLLFNALSASLFVLSIYRLCRHAQTDYKPVFLFLPIVFFIPLRNQLLFGQTYLLLFWLLAEGFIAYTQQKYFFSGLFWALAILLKVFPAIIILFVVLDKNWKALLWLMSCSAILVLASIGILGMDLWQEYLFAVLPAHSNGEISASFTTSYQSAYMLAKYLFIKDEVLNGHLILDSPLTFSIVLTLFKSLVLTLCTLAVIQKKDLISFGFLIFGAILFSPYGNTYASLLLLILFIGSLQSFSLKKSVVIGIGLFLVSNLSSRIFHDLPIIFQFPRLFIMTGLFLLIALQANVKVNMKLLLSLLVAFSVIVCVYPPTSLTDKDKHFLLNEDHLLMTDYGFKDGHLYYCHWNENGNNVVYTNYIIETSGTTDVIIKNNQLFYRGKQITFSSDSKQNASIVNQDTILYMSDKGKGKGFYTLRSISIYQEYSKKFTQ